MARKQKRPSRAQTRTALLADAARQALPERADVCVVGGGAAGLVAAICAAERGARVVVLERDLECGRSILATGNGRCNMANTGLSPSLYNNRQFVRDVCGDSWLDDLREFFLGCGLLMAEEAEGRLYPLSRQASSVREVLLNRAQRVGVLLLPAREVLSVDREERGFCLEVQEAFASGVTRTLRATRVVLATGGGCDLLGKESLSLRQSPRVPLLCPLECTSPDHPDLLVALDGRRVRARARLMRQGEVITAEEGEVLFRDYGVSGIVVFNLSRHVRPDDVLELDLLPQVPEQLALELCDHTLAGMLDPVLARALLREEGDRLRAVLLAKSLCLHVVGTRPQEGAQVHRGGLACEQFDPATLEALDVPGLHACGETLDVDGPCGGYNLAWAWKSGMVAGLAAGQGGTVSRGECTTPAAVHAPRDTVPPRKREGHDA